MSTKRYVIFFVVLLSFFQSAFANEQQKQYKAPPTAAKSGHIPVISDFEMKQCIKLYNNSEKLFAEILKTEIDVKDPKSVQNVRNKFDKHSRMVDHFNKTCGGKQSKSTCEAARKKHLSQGLSYQECK